MVPCLEAETNLQKDFWMTRVLVILVTYNGMRWLERCLSSVREYDLYVWDNDSSDGSADFVASSRPGAKLVRSAENLGFAKANNMGMKWAMDHGYSYVYLLNQDAWLEEGAMDKLLAAADDNPSYALLSPLQMADGFSSLDPLFGKCLGSAAVPSEAEIIPVKRVMAAHWLVRVEALRRIGDFNASLFPLYGQDDDWCNRALYHACGIGVLPGARAVHDRARRKESKEKIIGRNYFTGSLVRLADVNRPLWERFLFVCLFTLVKALKYRSLLPFKHFASICGKLGELKEYRTLAKNMYICEIL